MGEFCPSMTTSLALSDFDFALPRELIAQHPAAERSAARLLDARELLARDRHIGDLPGLLRAGDLLVVNDTAVIKARLFGAKASGVSPSTPLKPGCTISSPKKPPRASPRTRTRWPAASVFWWLG